MSFVKIGAVKTILYLRAHMNFFFTFHRYWPICVIFSIIDMRVILLSVCGFF